MLIYLQIFNIMRLLMKKIHRKSNLFVILEVFATQAWSYAKLLVFLCLMIISIAIVLILLTNSDSNGFQLTTLRSIAYVLSFGFDTEWVYLYHYFITQYMNRVSFLAVVLSIYIFFVQAITMNLCCYFSMSVVIGSNAAALS